MSIETAIHDAIKVAIEAAVDGDALYDAELHDTLYARVTKLFGVRVGDVEASVAPTPGGEKVEEFDATLPLQSFARVQGDTAEARATAREQARGIARAVAKIFFDDPTLGGRVRDSLVVGLKCGWGQVQAAPYAVAVLMVLVNGTGQEAG